MKRFYCQAHSFEGYRAEITIEWTAPMPEDNLPADRRKRAEEIADEVFASVAGRTYDIVQAMRGNSR